MSIPRSRQPLARFSTTLLLSLCAGLAMSSAPASAANNLAPRKIDNAKTAQVTSSHTETVLQQAKQLMQDGQPGLAYQLLEPLEFEHAGNTDFDYILGIAALDSGKAERATLALERVLAGDPNLAGARLDIARAWYVLGDFARARQELQALQGLNPPDNAQLMIRQLQQAIDEGEQDVMRTRRYNGYLEAGIGFDDNVTSVVSDFTEAVLATYNLPGFEPNGSAVMRSSSMVYLQGGFDINQKLNENWSLDASVDARSRHLLRSAAYDSRQIDWRLALQYKRNLNQWRLGLNLQQFWQETETPTANRRGAGLYAQWLHNRGDQGQLALTFSATRQFFQDVPTNDGDNYYVSFSWLHNLPGKWRPTVQASVNLGRDHAKYLLVDDKNGDKNNLGLRLFLQASPKPTLDIFASYSYTKRVDLDTFAHSTVVEHGRDHISDVNLGANWRFKPEWSLRGQWTYARNDSTIALNRYRRNEFNLALRYDF